MIKYILFSLLLILLTPSFGFSDENEELTKIENQTIEEFTEAVNAVKEKKYELAADIFEKLAEEGDIDAQFNYAILTRNGLGRAQNYSQALYWSWLSFAGGLEKADKVLEKIIEGKINSFYTDTVLSQQIFCNPELYEGTVGDMIDEMSGKLGEKIYTLQAEVEILKVKHERKTSTLKIEEEKLKNSEEYSNFWKRLRHGEFFTGEYKRIGKGGKEVWIQASYNPILDQKIVILGSRPSPLNTVPGPPPKNY